MKYALGLHQHHPLNEAFVTAEFQREFAQAAEQAGFGALFFTEHPIPGDEWLATGGHDALDPFVALAFVAQATTHLRLLTNLTVLPYRNPFLLAKAVATLDRLSAGRVTLGVGSGYQQAEFEALGVDFDERNQLFDESLAACRAAWRGESVEFDGLHFSARGNTSWPTPVQDPIPVWIGGNSTMSLRRVAERGHGWMPMPNPRSLGNRRRSAHLEDLDDLARLLDRLHEFRADAGRDHEPLDVMFFNLSGLPGDRGWSLERFADEQQRQTELGVTWTAVNCTASSPQEAIEWVWSFGDQVITPLRGTVSSG